jgi:ParB/RepB/Spo0J family partition protein
MKPNAELKNLKIEEVLADPKNPRGQKLGRKDVADLIASIPLVGILQALTAFEIDGQHILNTGSRRLQALRFLQADARAQGMTETPYDTVPVLVRPFENDLDAFRAQIAENEDRVDVALVHKAMAVSRVSADKNLDQTQIAKLLGKSADYVSKLLSVAAADEEVRYLLLIHEINLEDAIVLIRIYGKLPTSRQKPVLTRLCEERAGGKLSRDSLRKILAKTRVENRPRSERKRSFMKVDEKQVRVSACLINEKTFANEGSRDTFVAEYSSLLVWIKNRFPEIAGELQKATERACANDVILDADAHAEVM